MSTAQKYRKKPVVIEARQLTPVNAMDVAEWCGGRAYSPENVDLAFIDIKTLEGVMTASLDDWIIKGVQGEFYPCKPDIFAATYGDATESTPDAAIGRLTAVLTEKFGGPTQSESAVEMATRVLLEMREELWQLAPIVGEFEQAIHPDEGLLPYAEASIDMSVLEKLRAMPWTAREALRESQSD